MDFTENRILELLSAEKREGVIDKILDVCADQECRLCYLELGIN